MLIVETLTADGLATQAGLCVGDNLQSYNDCPLTSPALLQLLSENAVGTDLQTLQVHRPSQDITLSIPPGNLGVEVRPVLPSEVLSLYQDGQVAWQTNNKEKAGRLWQEAIQQTTDPF